MQIRSKYQFYELMERGCLGNTLRNWRSEHDAYISGVDYFGLREIGNAGGGLHTVVRQRAVLYTAQEWRAAGRRFIIDEAAPDTDVLLQGEICRTYRGWEGSLGIRTGMRMRESMRNGLLTPMVGVMVVVLLNQYLDENSRDDIYDLLELYPDATVEFASYPYTLGKIPHRNTIIWEVRNY